MVVKKSETYMDMTTHQAVFTYAELRIGNNRFEYRIRIMWCSLKLFKILYKLFYSLLKLLLTSPFFEPPCLTLYNKHLCN